ncbi:MAG TPA: adenylate/guanylate cyclase domain-containing protein [Gaiellaceae bacterium]|nr:adenylate/guanylate cyclase domain-containing protein [Gaiellaceae bacterium]
MRSDLPSGTVTFLFTDVEGSTRLLHELGEEAYSGALAEHRRLIREACTAEGGVEVDTQGDAFFFAFPTAPTALAAAGAFTERLAAEGPIRVRVGLHTGTPLIGAEGYIGHDVHRAARIAAAGHGGQVLVSSSTAALLDVELADLGEHRLKDLTGAERLYQSGSEEFPPLRTLDATNLPVASGPLLGRDDEVSELLGLLREGKRLVTITGAGGSGKTRLALQVAAELVGTVADGVFWVGLAPLADPDLVSTEVAHAIGAPDDLGGFLRDRELVLLLDNFEHLLGAAPTVSDLMAAAAGLRVLVTSRAPLRVSGEAEFQLDPLKPGDAVALFVERGLAVGRSVEPDATAEAICARLDDLPLAIELAAARLRLFGPEALLERLESTLPLLTGGSRDAPERQQTLRATIEWSYGLLDEPSRQLLGRLGVFAGGFPLEAAESVCDARLEELSALVDMSLLKSIAGDRLLMLETIREYALERLADSGEEDVIRGRHASEFARLAESAYGGRLDAEAEWSARLERDHDDLRAALDWLEGSDPDAALELAAALGWFWFTRGYLVEGAARLDAALAASSAGGRTRARALAAAGPLVARIGRGDDGRRKLEESVARWRELGDGSETAVALDALGWLLFYDNDDVAASLAAFEEELAIWLELEDEAGEIRARGGVCQGLVALGETERAEELSRELLERAQGDLRVQHLGFHYLADCALIRGDCDEAEGLYRESLRLALELGDVIETSIEVQAVAMAKAGQGESTFALELAASVENLWRSLGVDLHVAFWDELLERYLGAARAALGPEEADAARRRGLELPFDDAVELALGAATAA